MRLNIPVVGGKLRLVEDWTFALPGFWWNRLIWAKFFELSPKTEQAMRYGDSVPDRIVTLPRSIILSVTKIDFRPNDPYAIRFETLKKDNPWFSAHGRFWLPVTTANTANVEPVSTSESESEE